ncbi:MAG TPA: tetratricopeptide repeat protein, partial [Methylomirabilota bacterium]|nr:tetratricopeptide repeat protein [Methylomirabilota bacterium]
MRHAPAALAVLLVAATASAQPAGDGQSWESPMSAGDRAYQLGHYAEAESFFAAALERAERAGGAQDPRVALSLGLLASAYQAAGSFAKAEPLLGRALHISEGTLGPDHPEVAATLTAVGALATAQGRYAQAEP